MMIFNGDQSGLHCTRACERKVLIHTVSLHMSRPFCMLKTHKYCKSSNRGRAEK